MKSRFIQKLLRGQTTYNWLIALNGQESNNQCLQQKGLKQQAGQKKDG